MPLTPDEQAELASLDHYFEEKDQQQNGAAQVDAVLRTARTQPATPESARPFSPYRVIVGGVRDAIQGILDTGDALDDYFGTPTFGRNVPVLGHGYKLPEPEGSDHAGTAERVVRGIASFAIPFTGYLKATSALRGFGLLGRIGQGLVAGAAVDFTQVDPVGGNIANVLRDTFHLDNAMLNSLASEQDDSALETRFKAAVTGSLFGLAGDAAIESGARLLKLYRAWKGTTDEAAAVVDNIRKGPVKVDLPAEPKPAQAADGAVEADEVIHPSDKAGAKPAEEFVYSPKGDQPQDFEDVLDFLKSKAGDVNMDEETFARFAKNLLEGDPENALAKLGIDPLKIDFSRYKDGEMLGRLQKGLAEVYEAIAGRLGRTGTRVTERATIRGAEALASTPDVLKTLYGSTSNLAEQITAGRLFVGAHAIKLLGDARAALREIQQSGTGEAWLQFLESFERHAYFMGAIRGAGSEVGRALRSLQILAKASPGQATDVLNKALSADAEAALGGVKKLTVEEGASAFADSLGSDAERIVALQRLIDLKGDVSELSRSVREVAGSRFKRFNQAIKETVGSLFTSATAVYNLGAGVTYLGLNGIGKLLSATARTVVGSNLEAQRATMEAWGYMEGILGGFREAWGNTLGVLEREGLSELAINLDGLGLHDLARRTAAKSIKAGGEVTGHFERADVVTSKAFAVTTAERQALAKLTEELPGPKFFQTGLRGLTNLAAAGINAAGTAYRLGTTLFINLPDEFVGTLATRAGAYAQAVRIAAKEAGEMGLEGQAIKDYLKARTIQLFGEGPKGWAADGFEGGTRHAMARAGEAEAKMVLFQDEFEFGFNRGLSRWVNSGGGLASLVVPFIKTPLRILERDAIDFSPLGLFKGRIRKAIAAGGSQRDEALARLSLSMMAVFTAYQLAEDRTIVGNDGGYLSTARDAGRPSYSLRIGDDAYEFSKLDPIGTLLGFGADIRSALDAAGDDPDAGSALEQITSALVWATAANVLSKTWLTSIRQLTDLAGATSEDDAGIRWDKFLSGASTRIVPAAGVQKALEAWGDEQMRSAVGFSDGLLRSTLGASALPAQRDFMGRVLDKSGMNRIAGIRGDVMPSDLEDPLTAEMERLSFKEPASERRQKGVKLDATQFSRFLELRGQVVRDPTNGLTMEEALRQLVALPAYRMLPKAGRIAEIRKTTRAYSGLAAEALTNEDQAYAYARLREEIFEQSSLEGWTPEKRSSELTRFAQQLGIPQHQ